LSSEAGRSHRQRQNDNKARHKTHIAPPIKIWRQATMVTSNPEMYWRGQGTGPFSFNLLRSRVCCTAEFF
jgi:hypothetical protein